MKLGDPKDLRWKILLSVNLQVFFFMIIGRFDTTMRGIQDRNGIIFTFCVNLIFVSYFSALANFMSEKPLFVRESLSKSYPVGVYFLAKTLTESLEYFLLPLICSTIL